ncbi:MAG: hypothetical protein KF883_09915 [Thermomicrobiales bacterium]|nr:hypothetical protein [Thermomicrobiales bacterium]
MTEIRPEEKHREFMRRTLENLAFIHEHRGPDGPYEVTQLVNSFLGAMVHPWERMRFAQFARLSDVTIAEAKGLGLPVFQTDLTASDEPRNYREMFRFVRNAFAHDNIEFENRDGEIVGITLENCGSPFWRGTATLKDMSDLLQTFDDFANDRRPLHRDKHTPLIAYAAD